MRQSNKFKVSYSSWDSCACVRPSVRPSICLSVRLSVRPSICLSVCPLFFFPFEKKRTVHVKEIEAACGGHHFFEIYNNKRQIKLFLTRDSNTPPPYSHPHPTPAQSGWSSGMEAVDKSIYKR